MGKTTMTRAIVSKNSLYRPFRKSVSGNGFRHTLSQLKLFLMGFVFEISRLFKERNISRFLKVSILRGATIDNRRWVLDQGYLQPTALLRASYEYKSDIFISKIKSLGFFPDIVVLFIPPPEFAEKRQSKRGDIDAIKSRSESLGFSSLHEQYQQENLMWLDLVPMLESNGVSTIRVNFDENGNIANVISFAGQGEGRAAIVRELSLFLQSHWNSDL